MAGLLLRLLSETMAYKRPFMSAQLLSGICSTMHHTWDTTMPAGRTPQLNSFTCMIAVSSSGLLKSSSKALAKEMHQSSSFYSRALQVNCPNLQRHAMLAPSAVGRLQAVSAAGLQDCNACQAGA